MGAVVNADYMGVSLRADYMGVDAVNGAVMGGGLQCALRV